MEDGREKIRQFTLHKINTHKNKKKETNWKKKWNATSQTRRVSLQPLPHAFPTTNGALEGLSVLFCLQKIAVQIRRKKYTPTVAVDYYICCSVYHSLSCFVHTFFSSILQQQQKREEEQQPRVSNYTTFSISPKKKIDSTEIYFFLI